MYYISFANLETFLKNLTSDYEVYVPVKNETTRFYQKYTQDTSCIVFGEVRAFEPLKAFFSRAREKVADGFSPDIPHSDSKPYAIVGVKACDLKGFKVQDHVFKGDDYQDPFYMKLREENLIISVDCTLAIDTCFCLAVGIFPYAQSDFDINLSELENGFFVETGSEKGRVLIEKNSSLFDESSDSHITDSEARRNKVISAVDKNIKENNIPEQANLKGAIERNYESDLWMEESKKCVECGACTIICPTCHCFMLYDQKDDKKMERLRVWDSCMIKDYARVAGGANPREKLFMRLRNRFEKKFDFFPKVADVYACTCCGRCISACPAKIDIRKVLKKLVENG